MDSNGTGTVFIDPGSAVMELFEDALGPPKVPVGNFALWADWHGVRKHQVFPPLVTKVLRPLEGATLSGPSLLDATATDYLPVTRVEFLLTNSVHEVDVIAVAHRTVYGWLASWDARSVPSGSYSMRSLAFDSGARSSASPAVRITVHTLGRATEIVPEHRSSSRVPADPYRRDISPPR